MSRFCVSAGRPTTRQDMCVCVPYFRSGRGLKGGGVSCDDGHFGTPPLSCHQRASHALLLSLSIHLSLSRLMALTITSNALLWDLAVPVYYKEPRERGTESEVFVSKSAWLATGRQQTWNLCNALHTHHFSQPPAGPHRSHGSRKVIDNLTT